MATPDGTIQHGEYTPLPTEQELGRSPDMSAYKFVVPMGQIFEPSQEVVDSVAACFNTGIQIPSDVQTRTNGLPDSVLEFVLHRDEWNFVPVKRHQLDAGAKAFMRCKADLVCRRAQQTPFAFETSPKIIDPKVLRRSFVAPTLAQHQENLYLHLNTSPDTGVSTERILADLKKFVAETMKAIKKEITTILSDAKAMEEINRTCEVYRQILINIVFKDVIDHLDRMRAHAEKPEEQKQFLQLLNTAVKMLEIDGVKVELLSTKDAVVEGCVGLYKPSVDGVQPAVIGIPMSVYGTYEQSEFGEVLGTLAHELAHHVIAVDKEDLKQRGMANSVQYWDYRQQGHNLDHTLIAYDLHRRLQTLRFITRNGQASVVEDDYLVKKVMAQAEELFARRTPAEAAAEAAQVQEPKFPLVQPDGKTLVGYFTEAELETMAAASGKTLKRGENKNTGRVGYKLI